MYCQGLFFESTSHPDTSYSFESTGISVQEFKKDFQDGGRGVQLRFPIGPILAFLTCKSP